MILETAVGSVEGLVCAKSGAVRMSECSKTGNHAPLGSLFIIFPVQDLID